jgi:hypothetical protein
MSTVAILSFKFPLEAVTKANKVSKIADQKISSHGFTFRNQRTLEHPTYGTDQAPRPNHSLPALQQNAGDHNFTHDSQKETVVKRWLITGTRGSISRQ